VSDESLSLDRGDEPREDDDAVEAHSLDSLDAVDEKEDEGDDVQAHSFDSFDAMDSFDAKA
jgi:hypothetical protein